jgi:two-component system, OmpR family, heavy metal sensor histidine kinase CusS
MNALSLTTRLALLFAASAVIVLLALGWVVERAVENHFVEMDHHEIEGKLSLVRNLIRRAPNADALAAVPKHLENALVGHHHLVVSVYAADGSIWFTSDTPAFSATQLNSAERWLQWHDGEQAYRGLLAQINSPYAPAFTIAIAQDISHHEDFMREFRRTLAIVTLLAALLTALLGWAAARAGLRPLRRVAALAAQIEASRLDQRLPATQVPAEIESLATAFNAMLARLENSFRRLSEFSSDIAHELRTPVSNLMTQTQVALASKDSAATEPEQYREILYSNLEEYERMAQMIRDMLFLAQADNGLLKPSCAEVDLSLEIRALFDYFDAWAEERGVTLALEDLREKPIPSLLGDRLMLRRAFSNLLVNAIRHTPAGNTVWVRLRLAGGNIQISIENPGVEIAPEHVPRVFDRFYRIDPSRQRDAEEGAGLGLAIVKSIVEAHGGQVGLLSADGHTQFQMNFPAAISVGIAAGMSV